MPFLFHVNNQFTLIDDKLKQGLFTQSYTKSGFSRPVQLAPYPVLSYGAILDDENVLHCVFKNNKNQVYALEYASGAINRSLLLDDTKQAYDFSNLNLVYFNHKVHFFYMAKKPNTTSYSLLHQILGDDPTTLDTFLSDLNAHTLVKIFSYRNALYILYTHTHGHYALNCMKISSQVENFTLMTSEFPILDFNTCFIQDTLHIVYTRDVYGKEQLLYTNTLHQHHMPLTLCSVSCHPCIVSYAKGLWVSYIDNNVLYTMLSLDQGYSFAGPSPSSIQSHLNPYIFSTTSNNLMATTIYASIFNTLRLTPICAIDIHGIHPDLVPNRELELFVEGNFATLSTASTPSPSVSIPAAFPVDMPAPSLDRTSPSFSDPHFPEITKKRSVKSAAQAFMEEANGFDATPLI